MKRQLNFLTIVGVIFVALMGLPLLVGVWLPDVLTAPENVLAEQRLTDGYSFRVIQYWNHMDFYTTELRVISPGGQAKTFILDGDDNKSWSLPLMIDEKHRTATVTLRGGRVKQVDW